eukprot:TRINITY_DN1001_c1_g1_i1.p1 TRINITY_DN1001_c1_g1~~TRINITY_DN1001_c1_g1_i1.p1  ORF type:complete len:271 (+),score=38.66 TRINITY_DN1001_c1_g1_i1:52-864(+)
MFTVRVCSDVGGRKINLEIPFRSPPTLPELRVAIDETFTGEGRALSPRGSPHRLDEFYFKTQRMQIYDDRELRWVDLVDSMQLQHNRAQVYAFKADSFLPDVQQRMPAARPSTLGLVRQSSSPVRQSLSPQEISSPGTHGKTSTTHQYFGGSKGYLTFNDLESGFASLGFDFAPVTVKEMFSKADTNRDHKITFDEWQRWAYRYINTHDVIYFHCVPEAPPLTKEELALVEQEIRLERHKDSLTIQEQRFTDAAASFDRSQEGTPRRAFR